MLVFGFLVATSFNLHLIIKTGGKVPLRVLAFVYRSAWVTWARSFRRMLFDAVVLVAFVLYFYSGGSI